GKVGHAGQLGDLGGLTEGAVLVQGGVCSGASFTQIWSRNGQPAGTSFFNLRVVGTIPLNSRTITYTYHYTDLGTVGTTGAAAMGITTSATIPFISPSTAKTTQGGTVMPSTRTFAQLAASGRFAQTQTAAAGQGSNGATDTVFGVYQPSVKIKPPAGYTLTGNLEGSPFMFPPRWDKASYLNSFGTGAAVFSMITPMLYSKAADAPERAVALHIEKAFKTPGLTQPPSSTKNVPGQTTAAPLTRLYQDRKRRDDNRAQAVNACRRHFGPDYTAGGKDCDEYPFATTYEGAAGSLYDPEQLPNNYSVMALDSTQNQAAGTLLGQFLTKARLIDGPDDGFLVADTEPVAVDRTVRHRLTAWVRAAPGTARRRAAPSATQDGQPRHALLRGLAHTTFLAQAARTLRADRASGRLRRPTPEVFLRDSRLHPRHSSPRTRRVQAPRPRLQGSVQRCAYDPHCGRRYAPFE
ncbi:hypothetical protein EW053_37370, partial [Streptomyces sp. IB2014 016-6]